MKRPYQWIILLLVATVCLPTNVAAEQSRIYTMGVVPQYTPRRIIEIWQPIIDQVNELAHVKIVLKSSPSIPEFKHQLDDGQFDFAYVNPYDMLIANKRQGYLPILRDVGRKLFGIIVVKKDSPIKSVKELDGRKVAFPAPNALGASLIPRAEFSRKFHIKVKESYVRSHSSVYLNVVLGLTDAGGGVLTTLLQQPKEIQDQLRILYKTQEISPHPIVVHPRVPKSVQKKVINAFLKLGVNTVGHLELGKVPIKKIGRASLKDYVKLRSLDVSEFYVK